MKYTIILILTLASALALPSEKTESRNSIVPEGRISGGQDGVITQFPYHVLILVKDRDSKAANIPCGGSLLSKEWVLTAAHCLRTASEVIVGLGVTSRGNAEKMHVVSKKNFILHDNFKPYNLLNDIALIKIPSTEYSDKIQPVKLPEKSKYFSDYSGKNVIASGWGRIGNGPKDLANKLQWARLRVISNKMCDKHFTIFPENICTDTIDGVNICNGDSGGPLVLESSKIQIGIVSFSDKLCNADTPGAYTRITSYLDWIKRHTSPF